jgi:regulator of PEP synthase PpsR (kinase-PPPase family)
MMNMSQKLHIYAVSDSVGETAEKIAIASVLQFDVERNVTRFSRVNKEEQVKNIVSQAVKEDAIIVYTIVKPKSCLNKYWDLFYLSFMYLNSPGRA